MVGHRQHQQQTTFREMLTQKAKNFTRKAIGLANGREIIQGDEVEEFWARRDVSLGDVHLLKCRGFRPSCTEMSC